MYDVIIVGTRVAGAATAMLLAGGRGHRVLALLRPGVVPERHPLDPPGAGARASPGWRAGGCSAWHWPTPARRPPCRVRFDPGPALGWRGLPLDVRGLGER